MEDMARADPPSFPAEVNGQAPEDVAKLQNRIASLEREKESLYVQLEDRDAVQIPLLERKADSLETTNANLRTNNTSLRHESSRFEVALLEEKKRYEAEKHEREQAQETSRVFQQKCKAEEARANRAESKSDDIWRKYEALEIEYDKGRAMIISLHGMLDSTEAERDEAVREAENNHGAADRLQEIEDTFEPIFRELGVQLTPENLIERFTNMYNKSLLRRDDSEQSIEAQIRRRPSLKERKVSVASIGEELSALDSDGESEENSPVARFQRPEPQENGESGQSGQNGHASGRDSHNPLGPTIAEEINGSLEPEEALDGSWSAVDGDSPVVEKVIRVPSKGPDPAPLSAGLPDMSQGFDRVSAEAELSQDPAKADDGTASADKQPNGSLDVASGDQAFSRQDKELRLEAELASKEEQIRDLLLRLNSQAKVPTTGKSVTQYVTIVRESTPAESLGRAPWWMKVVLLIMLILWAGLTTSAWRERNLWLASNDTTFLYGRHLQSTSSQCHWAIVEWLENYIGLDKRLLG